MGVGVGGRPPEEATGRKKLSPSPLGAVFLPVRPVLAPPQRASLRWWCPGRVEGRKEPAPPGPGDGSPAALLGGHS